MQYQTSSYDLLKKLLENIPDGDACLEWPRGRNANNYGQLQTWNKERESLVHRQAWIETRGPIPDGIDILHRCDNPPCFRPSHLFLGDQTDNMRDCAKKGRVRNQSKLSEDDIREIRQQYADGHKQAELAEQFGLHQSTISNIVTKKHFANL